MADYAPLRKDTEINHKIKMKMLELSRFLGIIINMYGNDQLPPHFYVIYEDYEALFSIEDFKLISGKLPPRVIGLVIEWAILHKKELEKNWKLCIKQLPLKKIKPLV